MQWPHGAARRLAEVADQRVDLAAVVGDQRRAPVRARAISCRSRGSKRRGELGGQRRGVLARRAAGGSAGARRRRAARPSPAARRYSSARTTRSRGLRPAPRRPSPGSSAYQMRPFFACGEDARRRTARARPANCAAISAGSQQRAQLVGGVERRPLAEHAQQLEVGERGAQHQRADVVAARTARSRLTSNSAPAASSSSTSAAQRRLAWACRRRRSSRASGTSSGQANSSTIDGRAVAAGAADLLAVALEALGQVVVVDVADVGLVDAHAEGDGGDDDAGGREAIHHSCDRGRAPPAPCRRGRRAPGRPAAARARRRRARPSSAA